MKKLKFIDIIVTFILSFLTHSLYKIFPNTIFSIFFPVNESIWEHMKMLFSTIIISDIIMYFFIKNNKFNNYIFSSFITSILSILIYLLIFLPIYFRNGENMIIAISIMLIVIIIVKIIKYKLLNLKKLSLEKISIVLIIICYIIFTYLTYNPLKNKLFFDSENEVYGISSK